MPFKGIIDLIKFVAGLSADNGVYFRHELCHVGPLLQSLKCALSTIEQLRADQ